MSRTACGAHCSAAIPNRHIPPTTGVETRVWVARTPDACLLEITFVFI